MFEMNSNFASTVQTPVSQLVVEILLRGSWSQLPALHGF